MIRHPWRFFVPILVLAGSLIVLWAIAANTQTLTPAVELSWLDLSWDQLSMIFGWFALGTLVVLAVMVWIYVRGRRSDRDR